MEPLPAALRVCLGSAGPAGPFCNASTAGTSPGVLTAPQQAAVEAPGADKQQQLLAYVPLQLAVLLKQLAAGLTEDLQQAAEAAAADDGADRGPGDAVSLEVSQVALQVCG